MKEQLDATRTDHDELVEKLHTMNKSRHELENKLQDEHDRNKRLEDKLHQQEDILEKRMQDIEESDKRINEMTSQIATLEAQKLGTEKAFDLSKNQLNDRIKSLSEVINNEKETRELWIARYEDEQKNHTQTNSNLLQARSDMKDVDLELKNAKIKLNSANRQIQILQEQNLKFQHQVNEAVANTENLDRELNTQKEILMRMEMSKKEYINKLKKELDDIDKRYQHLLNENAMIGEDFRSRAMNNLRRAEDLQKKMDNMQIDMKKKDAIVDNKDMELVQMERKLEA